MTSSPQIQSVKPGDLSAITNLLKMTELPPDGIVPHLDNFLIVKNPDSTVTSEDILGCVGLEVYGESALLRSLAVHPDRQNKGLGSFLVQEITLKAKNLGITRLFLLTETAEKLFTKLGFEHVTRGEVPKDMLESIEFSTLCKDAPAMMKSI